MSVVLPVCSGAAAVRAFIKAGWVVDRQRGSHVMLKKDGSNVALSIPQHRQLGKGVLQALIADSELSVAEFIKYL
jgi:predicted RNA binding protein YcfA (HicA-like mRNA interferase family)